MKPIKSLLILAVLLLFSSVARLYNPRRPWRSIGGDGRR